MAVDWTPTHHTCTHHFQSPRNTQTRQQCMHVAKVFPRRSRWWAEPVTKHAETQHRMETHSQTPQLPDARPRSTRKSCIWKQTHPQQFAVPTEKPFAPTLSLRQTYLGPCLRTEATAATRWVAPPTLEAAASRSFMWSSAFFRIMPRFCRTWAATRKLLHDT